MSYQNIVEIERDINITSKSNLSDSEKQIGNAIIPPSYLEFATEMGYGLLMELFLTYVPFGKESENICDSLENRNKYWKGIFNEYLNEPLSIFENPENVELLKNAEPFMKSENGEIVFWDTRKSTNGEYPIYLANFPVGIYHIADNFKDCIHLLTNTETYKNVLKSYGSPLKPTFKPFAKIG